MLTAKITASEKYRFFACHHTHVDHPQTTKGKTGQPPSVTSPIGLGKVLSLPCCKRSDQI